MVAVGNGKKTEDGKIIPLDVKPADRILLGKYSGTEIKIDNEEYLILKEEEVLAVVEGKWRARFVARRLDGLLDEPRPGAPHQMSDAQVERVVTLTRESTLENATPWSTRLRARRCGMSQSAVSRIGRAFALQPHRSETFKLSRDPLFIEKVWDLVGLHLDPPERALVLCGDEKAQIQALDRTPSLLPCGPAKWSGGLTMTRDTEPPRCSRLST